MTVRMGVIGLGNIGQLHVSNLRSGKIARCELTAVSDADPARLEQFKDIQTFTDSSALIRSGAVDAVLIATPHYSHTTIGIEAFKHGLHVMVEKPISVHKADAEKLIAARKNKKLVFSAMFNLRADPKFIRIKKLIDAGELGEIQRTNWINTNWFRSELYFASGGWRATWKGEGGGILVNQCPHNLDVFQWLCGMPVRLRAYCNMGKYHNIEVEDEVTAYLEYKNGATGVFVASTGESPGTNRLEIAGDRGKLVMENDRITFTRNEVSARKFSKETKEVFGQPPIWNIEIPVEPKGDLHSTLTNSFVSAILDGTPALAPGEDGLHSVELANAMLYSTWTGKMIELPLNGKAYERELQKRIAQSKVKKKVVKVAAVDMTKSYQK